MSILMKHLLKGTSLALGAVVLVSGTAVAEQNNSALLEQLNEYNNASSSSDSFNQVNSVFQLSDVSPGDWAFTALQNLVEKYNCIVGYPDGTFRGDRALTRYEFAAGLNACVSRLETMILENTVSKEDFAQLQALVQEFEAELATLSARVDDIDGRVQFLEDHQFSTTTKLNGEAIFSLNAAFGDEKADGSGDEVDENVTFSDRVRLNFDTSFTGEDRLRTRLEAGNIARLDDATGTDMARLGYDANNGNDVEITDLYYRFPIGDNTRGYVGTVGLDIDDIFAVTNPYFESSGDGALSRFGRRNPATLRGPEGAGIGFNHSFSDKVTFSALYLADSGDAPSPANQDGLFDGSFSAGAQLAFAPSENIDLALSYIHSFQPGDDVNLSGSTGSDGAKEPFGENATSSENFGFEASWMISPRVNLAGWVGYTTASDEVDGGDADIWNWAVNAAFLDVGGDGNVLGLIFGQPPKLNSVSGDNAVGDDDDTSYLAELQYRYKINDNITITPGAYAVFNPNHSDDNDTIYVGTIRTTFKF